jgi:hypothetical protein
LRRLWQNDVCGGFWCEASLGKRNPKVKMKKMVSGTLFVVAFYAREYRHAYRLKGVLPVFFIEFLEIIQAKRRNIAESKKHLKTLLSLFIVLI